MDESDMDVFSEFLHGSDEDDYEDDDYSRPQVQIGDGPPSESKIRLDKLVLLLFLLVFLFARKCEQKKRTKPLEWGLKVHPLNKQTIQYGT
jgi:hypothetical protein